MKPTLILSALLLTLAAAGQNKIHDSRLQLGLGYSTHGTGDMKGVAFFCEYGKFLGKRFELSLNVKSTIHGGSFQVYVTEPDGTVHDNSWRYSNAGLQIGPVMGYHLVQAKHHLLTIQAGAFARYQNSTFASMYSFFIRQNAGIPEPSFQFVHNDKQNTFAAGYSVDLAYDFITTRKMMFGLKVGFQNDSNADVITQVCLTVGRRI